VILVTGASGFIGLNLCLELVRRRQAFVPCDRHQPRVPLPGFTRVNLLDREGIGGLVHEVAPTAIIHLGARTDLEGRTPGDYATNTVGLEYLLEAAGTLAASPRFISASSRLVFRIGAVPSTPYDYSATTAYGRSKIAGEQLLRATDPSVLPWVIIRPTSIWGPWFDVPYRTFFDAVRSRRYVHPAGRPIRKSFGFIGNIIHQILAIVTAPAGAVVGRPFFLADAEPIEVGRFSDAIAVAFGVPRPRRVPAIALRPLAWAGDIAKACRVLRAPPLTSFRLDNLVTDMVYDLQPTMAVTGPMPFSLEQGIVETVSWMRSDSP